MYIYIYLYLCDIYSSYSQRSQIHIFDAYKPLSHSCSDPVCLHKNVQISMTKCILIKSFKQSLSCLVSVCLTKAKLGCEVSCHNISTLTAARMGDIEGGLWLFSA